MIADLLPPHVASAELLDDVDEALLYREELDVIAAAGPKRRHEFVAGRVCARRALADLGLPAQPILRGESREPVWPAGVVGSITHCSGYRAAAVAHSTHVSAIGIDAERHAPLPAGVLRLVASTNEATAIDRLRTAHPETHWDRLIFSAKEAVYKANFSLHRTRLGFKDVDVVVEPAAGGFVALVDGGIYELPGRWLVRDGLVLTTLAVAA